MARYETALEDARTRMATVAQRRAEFEIARQALADASVRAPFDGVVQTRPANLGEYVATGAPIVQLVKTDPLRLRLEVPERECMPVRTGQTVRLLCEGDTNAYRGRDRPAQPGARRAEPHAARRGRRARGGLAAAGLVCARARSS